MAGSEGHLCRGGRYNLGVMLGEVEVDVSGRGGGGGLMRGEGRGRVPKEKLRMMRLKGVCAGGRDVGGAARGRPRSQIRGARFVPP